MGQNKVFYNLFSSFSASSLFPGDAVNFFHHWESLENFICVVELFDWRGGGGRQNRIFTKTKKNQGID